MNKLGNSRLVIWVEKVDKEEPYIRVEALFLTPEEEIDTIAMVNNIYRIKLEEEQNIFNVINFLSNRYGIDEIIQSNYLITDNRMKNQYTMSTTAKKLFQDEIIINVSEEDLKTLLQG